MNYQKIYNDLIQKRRQNILVKSESNSAEIETHHIVPKTCGGLDLDENLVNLTVREHLFAHLLLLKIYKGQEPEDRLLNAWMQMSYKRKIKSTKFIQTLRIKAHKKSRDLISKGLTGMFWINNGKESRFIHPGEIPDGFVRGRLMTRKLIQHNRQVCKDTIFITDGVVCKRHNKNNPIPSGFHCGKLSSELERMKRSARKNQIRMYFDFFTQHGLSFVLLREAFQELNDTVKDDNHIVQLFARQFKSFNFRKSKIAAYQNGKYISDTLLRIQRGYKFEKTNGIIYVTDGKCSKLVKYTSIPSGFIPGKTIHGVIVPT